MATEVRRREALRPGNLGYARTDKSINFLPKLPPAGVFEICFKSKQSFRNFFNCTNRLRYDGEKALQSVTILSHRSNLGSNSYPSDGPRGRRCAPRGAWSAGESSAGAGRARVLRDLLRHTLGCPVRLGTPLDIRVHGALDLREDQISTVHCLLSARPSRPRPAAASRTSHGPSARP